MEKELQENKVEVKTAQQRLETDYYSLVRENVVRLDTAETPTRLNVAVNVGTSETRAIDFNSNSRVVNESNIVRMSNEYAILTPTDREDLSLLEFEEKSFSSMTCIEMRNISNLNSPISKGIVISKGLLSDKLLKTSGYSVSNSDKYSQVDEYIVNTYTGIISIMYSNMIHFLERGEIEKAQRAMNVELNLAYMLPDEEKMSKRHEILHEAMQGTVEFSLPMMGGIRGKFSIRKNPPHQWLDVYGEAECAIYYYLIKNPTPENRRAFKDHGVAVIDAGEGSFDIVFFKQRELMERASSTSRKVNGSALIARTLRNVENEAYKKDIPLRPTMEGIKRILCNDPDELMLETPTQSYDISDALTNAKKEIAGEMANIFKNTFEKNTVLGGVDNLFLVVLAGRTMTDSEKSPSLGKFLADRLQDQLGIHPSICHITHPDSNLLGAALKLLMKMNKFANRE